MKCLICLALSLAFVHAAAAQDRSGAYMGVALGSFSLAEEEAEDPLDDFETLDDSASVFRIMGGYRFNDYFALEGGWGETGDFEESITEVLPPFGNITLNVAADLEILTVRALGFLPFEKVSLVGGVGYYDVDLNVSANASFLGQTLEDSFEENDSGLALVGGFEVNLERIDIRAELEWFDLEFPDVEIEEAWDVTVGVVYHF